MEYPSMKIIEPNIAFSLRYAYTTWSEFDIDPTIGRQVLQETNLALQQVDLRLLEGQTINHQWQLLVSAKPHQSPLQITRLIKTNLSTSMSLLGYDNPLNRRFAIRSIGNNTSKDLTNYLALQVERREYVDPRFSNALQDSSKQYVCDSSVPTLTRHGKYWYELHLVIATNERYTVASAKVWELLVSTCEKHFAEHGEQLKSLSLLPDHIHIMLLPKIQNSPLAVGKGLIERLNKLQEKRNLYRPSFYVGTYGAYSMAAVRRKIY
jgi:REP element-mobilizing transposase RayT